ncbi:MAG: hypothetical protein SFY56_14400 [Bacteroidota bacterium]|nr:hypothetical protein [Bacteroidota bacterium]
MKQLTQIRIVLVLFITLLILSGVTAFPVKSEIAYLMNHLNWFPVYLQEWIIKVNTSIQQTPDIMLYGTDWLAFAHIIISIFFIPVYINPTKYKVNLIIGMAACILVFPLAFVCGPVREIPFFHQLIDCCFGVFGFLFLWIVYRKINVLSNNQLTKKL